MVRECQAPKIIYIFEYALHFKSSSFVWTTNRSNTLHL